MNGESRIWRHIMKAINDFFSWGLGSGFFVAVIWFAWGYVKPLLDAKVKTAKTAQQRELLSLIDSLANTAVTSLVGNQAITGSDKFKAATSYVNNVLNQQGHEVSAETINHAVQSAYEKSDLTPTVDPAAEPQTGVVVHNG